jgi:hypothetical protein
MRPRPEGRKTGEFSSPFTGLNAILTAILCVGGIFIMSDKLASAAERNPSLVFEGVLLETPSEAPRCGDLMIAVAHAFRVNTVLQGKYKYQTIVILIPCPDSKGEHFFAAGGKYHVEASKSLEAASAYTHYNDYPDRRLFWSIKIGRLN